MLSCQILCSNCYIPHTLLIASFPFSFYNKLNVYLIFQLKILKVFKSKVFLGGLQSPLWNSFRLPDSWVSCSLSQLLNMPGPLVTVFACLCPKDLPKDLDIWLKPSFFYSFCPNFISLTIFLRKTNDSSFLPIILWSLLTYSSL